MNARTCTEEATETAGATNPDFVIDVVLWATVWNVGPLEIKIRIPDQPNVAFGNSVPNADWWDKWVHADLQRVLSTDCFGVRAGHFSRDCQHDVVETGDVGLWVFVLGVPTSCCLSVMSKVPVVLQWRSIPVDTGGEQISVAVVGLRSTTIEVNELR